MNIGWSCELTEFIKAKAHHLPIEDQHALAVMLAAASTPPAIVGHRLTYKNGKTAFIDRAPDSFELRECMIEPVCIAAPTQPAPEVEPVAWRAVVDFEGLYDVSNHGQIRSTVTGRLLSTRNRMGAGYIKADLWKNGKRTQTSVHRIVALAFLGEGEEVNHKNGDKTDNRLTNIEWSTRVDNVNHSRYVLGNDVKPVVAICLQTGKETAFPSIEEAERSGGFNATCVSMCINGHKKTHKGHSWHLRAELEKDKS
ncbi:MAG: NUMOD4 motif-containing HNH endonuclease [Candidatus Vecturithrix sp.]|jgi:hypothetical protein|nr:NUMOD4 motif-containing HNH endonuclease [Candidatus Vecturithrix sp.]